MAQKKSRKPVAKKKPAARKAPARRAVAAKKKPAARKAPARRAAAAKKKPATVRKAAKKATARKVARKPAAVRKTARKPAAKASSKRVTLPSPPKDGRPAQAPALFPYLTVRDAESSLAFYQAAFGFQPHGPALRDREGRVMHASMRLYDAVIMFAPQNAANPMRTPADSGAPDSLTLYVYVPDVDLVAERAVRGGATLLQKPADQFWGDRITVLKDPDGYHWTFATNVAEFDPSKVPY